MLFFNIISCNRQIEADYEIEDENLKTTRRYIEHGGHHGGDLVHVEEKCDLDHHGDCHHPVTETISSHSDIVKEHKDEDSSEKVIELFNNGSRVGHRVRRKYNLPHNIALNHHPIERIKRFHHPIHLPPLHRHLSRLLSHRVYYNNPNNVNYDVRVNHTPLSIRLRHGNRHHNVHGYAMNDYHVPVYSRHHGHGDSLLFRDRCVHEPLGVFGHSRHNDVEIEHIPSHRLLHEEVREIVPGVGHLRYFRDGCRHSHDRGHALIRLHNPHKNLTPYYYEIDDDELNEDSKDINSHSLKYKKDRADRFVLPG